MIHDTSGLFSQGDVTDRPCPAITIGVNSINSGHYPVVSTIEGRTVEPETDISRYAIGREWDKIGVGGRSDKYLQLTRPDPDGVSGTITAEGGNTSKASVAHPTERRKFSIAELKRICAFPDDFQLTGSYAQQWERLGRAVPPVMMRTVAEAVRDGILAKLGGG